MCERVAYQAKQTNKPSQSLPPLRGTNKQTLLLVCFQLFAFLCHIFISSRKVSPAVCQLFCAIDSAPVTSACNIDCHLQAGRLCSNSQPAYPFDTFSHLSPRLLLALIAFPSSSSSSSGLPFGCLIYCAVSDCFIFAGASREPGSAHHTTTFDALLSSRFYAQQFYRFMNYASCACVRANWQRGAYIMRQMMSHPLRKLSPFMASQ